MQAHRLYEPQAGQDMQFVVCGITSRMCARVCKNVHGHALASVGLRMVVLLHDYGCIAVCWRGWPLLDVLHGWTRKKLQEAISRRPQLCRDPALCATICKDSHGQDQDEEHDGVLNDNRPGDERSSSAPRI